MYRLFWFVILQIHLINSLATPDQALLADDKPSDKSHNRQDWYKLEIRDPRFGHRNVSYFVTDTGLAVVDGDVIYGPVEDLLAHSVVNIVDDLAFSVPFPGASAWPSATVQYKYNNNSCETALQAQVGRAIAKWQSVAPYLTFTKLINSDTPTAGVVTISQPGGRDLSCQASIGFSNTPLHVWLDSCDDAATIHELGHVLGLRHEHQRPDRDSYIHFDCANLRSDCDTMPPGTTCCTPISGCCQHLSDFDKFTDGDWSGPYDVNSIMHYSQTAFSFDGTAFTLYPINPRIVFPSTRPQAPSPLDFDRICRIYDAWCPKAKFCHSISCPTPCVIQPECSGQICSGAINELGNVAVNRPPNPPPCCFTRPENQECRNKRSQCTHNGCDFLKP